MKHGIACLLLLIASGAIAQPDPSQITIETKFLTVENSFLADIGTSFSTFTNTTSSGAVVTPAVRAGVMTRRNNVGFSILAGLGQFGNVFRDLNLFTKTTITSILAEPKVTVYLPIGAVQPFISAGARANVNVQQTFVTEFMGNRNKSSGPLSNQDNVLLLGPTVSVGTVIRTSRGDISIGASAIPGLTPLNKNGPPNVRPCLGELTMTAHLFRRNQAQERERIIFVRPRIMDYNEGNR